MTTPDVASLGLAIDSSQAEKGALTLDKLAASARKFEDQATKMALGTTTAFKSVGGGVDAAAKKLEDNAAKMSGAFAKVGKDAALGAVAVGDAASKMVDKVEDSAAASSGALKRLERRAGAGVLDERPTIGPNIEHVGDGVYKVHPVAAEHDPLAQTTARISQVRAELSGATNAAALGDASTEMSRIATQAAAATVAYDQLATATTRAKAAAAAIGAGHTVAGLEDATAEAHRAASEVNAFSNVAAKVAPVATQFESVAREVDSAVLAFDRLTAAAERAGTAAIGAGARYAAAGKDMLAATGTFGAAAAAMTPQATAEAAAIEDVTRSAERQHAAAERLSGAAMASTTGATVVSAGAARKSVTTTANDNARLAPHEWTNLSRQVQDVITMGAMGATPIQIATSQGAQIFDIFASSSVGAKAALADFGSTALRVATHPLTGLVAVVGTAGFAVMRFRDQQAELERALNGVGRAAGASAGQLSAIADATARSGSMSRGQAVSGAAQIAQAGIGVENIPTLLGDAPRFSRAFGLELADAYAEIVKIVGDQGLGAFERRFGPVNLATKETVTALEQMGRFSEAAAMKTRLFDSEVQKTKDSTGLLARGWEAFTSLPGKALDGLGAGLDALLPTFRTVELPRQAQAALPAPGAGSLSDYERRIGLSQEITPAQRARDLQDLNRQSELAGPLIDQLSPDDVQRRTMERQLAVLKPLTETADGLAALGERASAAKDVVARLSTALANFQTPAERMRQDNELSVRSISAYSFEQKTSIAAEQARVTTLRQTHDKTLAAIAAEGARNAALAESARRLDDMAREAQDRAQLRGLSPLQASLAEVDIRYGRLREQSAPQDAGRIGALQQQDRLNVLAQSATSAIDSAMPQEAQLRGLRDSLDAIRKLTDSKDGLAALGDRANDVTEAVSRLNVAMALASVSVVDRINLESDLRLREIDAQARQSFSLMAAVTAQRAFLAEIERSHSVLAAATAAQNALNEAVASANAEASRFARNARDQLYVLQGETPFERAMRRIDIQEREMRQRLVPGAEDVRLTPLMLGFDRAGNAVTRFASVLEAVISRISPERAAPVPAFVAGGLDLSRARDAIAAIESRGSGDYSAIGPRTASGDRGYGRYQVMGANIPTWTQAAFGRELTPQQFLANPAAQDAVFDQQFGASVARYGNASDAASIWFTGRPLAQGAAANDNLGTTGSSYVSRFLNGYSGPGGSLSVIDSTSARDIGGGVDDLRMVEYISSITDALQKENQSIERQRVLFDAQNGVYGLSAEKMAAMTKEVELLTEAQQQGVTKQELVNRFGADGAKMYDELREKIHATATAYGDLTKRQEEQRRLRENLDLARGTVNDTLSGGIRAVAHGQDVGAALQQSMSSAMDRVIDMQVSRFTETLLGQTGTTNGGVLGDLLGLNKGGDRTTAQMDVNAGVVNVNGSVAGGVPGVSSNSSAGGGGLLGAISSLFGGGSLPTVAQGGMGPDMPAAMAASSSSGGGAGLFSSIASLFAFRDGGVMTSAGELPLHRYATGGVANSPQLALFGEGRHPEAFIPMVDPAGIHVSLDPAGGAHVELPGGRGIPAVLTGPNAPEERALRLAGATPFAAGGVMTPGGAMTLPSLRDIGRERDLGPPQTPQAPQSYGERPAGGSGQMPQTQVTLVGAQGEAEVRETRRRDGGVSLEIQLKRAVKKMVANGDLDREFGASFGMRRSARPF